MASRWRSSWRTLCALVAITLLGACGSGTHLSFLDPQGPIAATQRKHFLEVLALLAVFVALPIFVQIPWLIWRYRYGAEGPVYDPRWRSSKLLEVMAWAGPLVIVAMLGVLVWRSTLRLDPYRPLAAGPPPLRIQVVGYDWKWLFIYPEQGVASIGVMPVPVGRPLAFEITSATVMQSLLIPALGSQIYAMGGMVTRLHLQADKPGRFLGENTMYSGDGFHQERFVAVGMQPQAFDDWVRRAQAGALPLDDGVLGLIARRSTFADLKAALPPRAAFDDGLYFNSADPRVFRKVVDSTMTPTAR